MDFWTVTVIVCSVLNPKRLSLHLSLVASQDCRIRLMLRLSHRACLDGLWEGEISILRSEWVSWVLGVSEGSYLPYSAFSNTWSG